MNTLFPIFVKLDQIETLLVGGGPVGLEKLSAMLRNNAEAKITLVAETVLPEIYELAQHHSSVQIHKRKYQPNDLINKQLVILATGSYLTSFQIKMEAEALGILANVADTPDLCDFYLGSIVQKDDLKIAISTNGKSPTLAKRMREYLENSLPDNIQELLDNLHLFREQLKGDFEEKVKIMNEVTKGLLVNQN
ncbi:MAG: bifunctional precorrin-2 dehydrogenase/sirohydrochlorin ferrochelatase [Microscillaceae bacterium]|jgi:siroheme synthase-like protein|nr:bifunctional precorrin-2 dehydrogenase/sirohydrochlorin ferrochelatase [Microscillaceae bacterium]